MTPRPVRSREDARAYHSCLVCGLPVLTAETTSGQVVHLDVSKVCYAVAWADQAELPRAFESRAYAVHACGEGGAT